MSPEEEIRRAGKAHEVLENEVFREAVSAIRNAIEHARLNSGATDVALREKLYAQELGLEAVLTNLRTYIETGMLAEETLRRRGLADAVKEAWQSISN